MLRCRRCRCRCRSVVAVVDVGGYGGVARDLRPIARLRPCLDDAFGALVFRRFTL